MNREKIIIRTSILGIIANLFLAAFKAAVGLISHSVAIVLDAVNNLSDALSSLITIIGTKLAGKSPDKKHPLGYGRIEYLSATIISLIVLYAGITSLIESVKKILQPDTPDYSAVTLLIIAVAVAVKLLLGRYVKKTGEEVDSDSLIASGSDAAFDAVISASTLVAAILFLLFHIRVEAWLGAFISLIIIKSGFEMLRDTISEILGERVDAETAKQIRDVVTAFPEVMGIYDLIVHNYGPERLVASAHIAIPDTMNAGEIDTLERDITQKLFETTGIALTGISVYSVNTGNEDAARMRKAVKTTLDEFHGILQMHGFYVNEERKEIKFDIVIDYDVKDPQQLCRDITQKVRELFPDYDVQITPDYDTSD